MLGALAWVSRGARNQADCACLTGSRVLQGELTPLHAASVNGKVEAIQALLAAKADVHAKAEVRGGEGGCWEGGEGSA
jgi:hypothetical protein